jgi:hypothetical protein
VATKLLPKSPELGVFGAVVRGLMTPESEGAQGNRDQGRDDDHEQQPVQGHPGGHELQHREADDRRHQGDDRFDRSGQVTHRALPDRVVRTGASRGHEDTVQYA